MNAVFLSATPAAALAGKAEIGAIAAEALGGTALRRALAALVGFALLTSISSMLMAGPRVYAQMAEDGLLPGFLRARGAVPLPGWPWLPVAFVAATSGSALALVSREPYVLGLGAATLASGLPVYRWLAGAGARTQARASSSRAARSPDSSAPGTVKPAEQPALKGSAVRSCSR